MRAPLVLASLVFALAAAAGPPPQPAPLEVEDARTAGELPTSWGVAFGDLDAMRKRGVVRALVVPTHIGYFVQDARQYGMNYEWLVAFEKQLNAGRKRGQLPVRVAIVPTSPERFIADLVEGRGDIAALAETVTRTREAQIDFAQPLTSGRHKVIATRDDVPAIESLDALGPLEVWVRNRSSAQEQLAGYNAQLRAAGKPRIEIRIAAPHMNDEDLLQMLDAGLIDATLVHGWKVEVYRQAFKRIKAHEVAVLAQDEDLAWSMRKGSPLLKAELDRFWRGNRLGTKLGNILVERYLEGGRGLKDSKGAAEREKYRKMVALFRQHADRYHMDHLLMMAQGYQESQLDQSRRSPVGAIGVMQVMPGTAAQMKVGDVTKLEHNVHAGVKYMRWIMDNFFEDPAIEPDDKVLFGFAGYNAGPTRIQKLRVEARKRGLDPNRWFGNVEIVAAQRIGREPVDYVSNIYKYYLAYKLVAENEARRKAVVPPAR